MSQGSPSPDELKILGKFAGIVGLLGLFLYFTGWIYRWSYFRFYQLEVFTLDLPPESFLIVSFQVFLGSFLAICRTALAAVVTAILIHLTLWLLQKPTVEVARKLRKLRSRLIQYTAKHKHSWIAQQLKSLIQFRTIKISSINFLHSVIDEAVVVVWILIALFWLARLQGTTDARQDAVNDTSLLPVVTLVTPHDRLALGRRLDKLQVNPSLKEFRIIGDKELFDQLVGREINSTTDLANPRVWRLLIARNGSFYIFKSLPPKPLSKQRPAVLVIRESESGDHLLILSPQPPRRVQSR